MKKKLPDWAKQAILDDVKYITNLLIELERCNVSPNESKKGKVEFIKIPILKSRKKELKPLIKQFIKTI